MIDTRMKCNGYEFDITNIIHRVRDDSFVVSILLDEEWSPFCVTKDMSEYAGLYEAVLRRTWQCPECVTEEPPYAPPVPTLEEAKADKLEEINAAADSAIAMLTATYPNREIATFDKQEAEARAYAADPATAQTPLLSALAQARGIELPELVRRVIAKADAFAVASGSIIGQRQALEDRLDTCTTIEEVRAITVNIAMPGGEGTA